MTEFERIKQSFVERYEDADRRYRAFYKEAEQAMESAKRHQRIAAKKMGEYYKLNSKAWNQRDVHWVDDLVVPLLKIVQECTGLDFYDYAMKEGMRTYGLRRETYTFAHNDKGECIASLCFTPGEDEKGQIFLDTGENRGNYHPDSIGGMNNFGNVTEEVTSIEVVIENLKRRNPELNL